MAELSFRYACRRLMWGKSVAETMTNGKRPQSGGMRPQRSRQAHRPSG
jgi:hypothetical protein